MGLIVLAVGVFGAALFVFGLDGLIPFGRLLVFSTDSDEEETGRQVVLTRRNLGLAAAMVAGFAWVNAVRSRGASWPTLMPAGAGRSPRNASFVRGSWRESDRRGPSSIPFDISRDAARRRSIGSR